LSGIDIFLSYSREDRSAARHIAESFTAEGLDVWWDAALQSGQTFDEVIEQRLKEAKAVVVLWSPRSVTSRWVRAEATLADRRNKLVPAIIEPCDRPIAFELTHTADLSDWTGDAADTRWQSFVTDVRRMVQRNGAAEATAEPAPPKPARTTPLRELRSATPPPVSRDQLRPGNDDVIFASTSPKGAQPQVATSEPQPAAPDPESDEFHCLCVIEEDAERCFPVAAAGIKIGRTAPADAIIAHPSVSREHCMVGLANDELIVSDLNSTNGTFIDGQRIGRTAVLPVGSVLRVGQVSLSHEVRSRGDPLLRSGNRGGMRSARLAATP
jgi:hypothetical protein